MERMLHVKSKFAGHLLDDIQLDGGGILFVVNSEEYYTSFVLGNDGVGRDNACTARLASPLGLDGHANLTDAGTKFCTLEGIFLKGITESLDVLYKSSIRLQYLL